MASTVPGQIVGVSLFENTSLSDGIQLGEGHTLDLTVVELRANLLRTNSHDD